MYVIKADYNPILKIRLAEGLTPHQLADMAGVTRGRIWQVENGLYAKKVPKKILRVVARLGYDPDQVQAEYQDWLKRQLKAEEAEKHGVR